MAYLTKKVGKHKRKLKKAKFKKLTKNHARDLSNEILTVTRIVGPVAWGSMQISIFN